MMLRVALPLSLYLWLIDSLPIKEVPYRHVERDSPAVQFRFYDVTLDNQLCEGPNQELRSEAVDDYIYIGRLLETSQAVSTRMCIQQCYHHDQCVSLNYFKPKSLGAQGFCELLGDNQWDNPIWMRRYPGAVYYERIECVTSGTDKFQQHPNVAPKSKNSQTQNFLKSIFNKIVDHARRAQLSRQ